MQFDQLKRREVITLLGGAAVTWPGAARAQEREQVRRVGVLIALAEGDPEAQAWATAFQRRLQELGWTAGRNIRVDFRFGLGTDERRRAATAELVGTAPD